jgi:hypothetical protein
MFFPVFLCVLPLDAYLKSKRRGAITRLKRAAACIFVFFAASATVLISVRATRTAIFNAFLNIRDKYTEIQFKDSEKDDGLYRPSYLPEGFSETSSVTFGSSTMLTYTNEAGEEIMFTQSPAGTSSMSVDNENMAYTEVRVNDSTAYLFEAKSEDYINILTWQTNGIVFEITSKTSGKDLVKIAESIEIN